MTWRFFINGTELSNEPIGWTDVTFNISRDERWHGIFFEAATSTLQFYGSDAEILRSLKNTHGLAATATIEIQAVCGQEIDVLTGSLDFGTYIETCSQPCTVQIAVEKAGCTMTLRNRYDQKVDLSSNRAFDKQTILQDYAGLNFEMEIPAQELDARVEGYVSSEGDTISIEPTCDENRFIWVRPNYLDERFNSINSGFLSSPQNQYQIGFEGTFGIITPQLLNEDNQSCFQVPFDYEIRFKGRFSVDQATIPTSDNASIKAQVRISSADELSPYCDNDNIFDVSCFLHSETIFTSSTSAPTDYVDEEFDITFTGSIASIPEGSRLSAWVYFPLGFSCENPLTVTFDPETYFLIRTNKSCPPTNSDVSLIHETGSRIVEAITDGCMRMRSTYYGRTDSEPFAASEDGCGSLRVLTSGLRLRNAENPTHFMSLQDFFNGLRGIDNIGIGIEPDPAVDTREVVRIEPVEYFYQDVELLRLPGIPNGKFILDPKFGYSLIKIGYTKWEVERVNGLDEFNSNKEFRTSLSTIDNTLDALSPFVAGGYPIEVTRQQSFADSGGADTTFDNENFIICVERNAYGYQVEQGNIIDASNFYSPDTAYNWRIRPFYNLMRWWRSIAQSYVNLVNTASQLFFSAGTGNLLATGELPLYDPCKLEDNEKSESEDLNRTDFAVENLPIYKPERLTFENYPLSLRDYNTIKSNPYGYISVQCGTGEYIKAYILSINYRPSRGDADFNLILKW